jgi:hypothetical protein
MNAIFADSSHLFTPVSCYMYSMTRDQVKEILDRVLNWPPERQEKAARVLAEMEAQDESSLTPTDEQVAEVKRRLADPNPKTIPAEEVFRRFRSRRA